MSATAEKRKGRPANEVPSVRISPRFPENIANTLRKASALKGVSVTSFVIEASKNAAEKVIEDETRWKLSEEETATLAEILARPPCVNAAAKNAEKLASDVELRS